MGLAESERKKDEKINGIIYDMSPAPGYQHGIVNGKYILEQSFILQDDKGEEDYNAETMISLKAFLHIAMALSEIFEGVDE